jgi:Uma2 family endonuclease
MVAMTVASTELHADRPLTVADLTLIEDDGHRYELDDGVLVMFPAPSVVHQLVVGRLVVALSQACQPDFLVLPGPGVEISPIHFRVPDIAVSQVRDVSIDDTSVTKPPVLAIEVASPSTAVYDRNRKKDVYAGFGIESYWIVKPDLNRPSLTAFRLTRGKYRLVAEISGDDTFRAMRPFACEIVPAALVAGSLSS